MPTKHAKQAKGEKQPKQPKQEKGGSSGETLSKNQRKKQSEALLEACQEGDENKVKELLSAGANGNATDKVCDSFLTDLFLLTYLMFQ